MQSSESKFSRITAVVSEICFYSEGSRLTILKVETEGVDYGVKIYAPGIRVAKGDLVEASGNWYEIEGKMVFNAVDIEKL